jgi:hypothetical protein
MSVHMLLDCHEAASSKWESIAGYTFINVDLDYYFLSVRGALAHTASLTKQGIPSTGVCRNSTPYLMYALCSKFPHAKKRVNSMVASKSCVVIFANLVRQACFGDLPLISVLHGQVCSSSESLIYFSESRRCVGVFDTRNWHQTK